MGSPANLRLHSDALLRMFTVTAANALIPRLEESFLRLDPKLARLRELRELIEDAESYYGEGLANRITGKDSRPHPQGSARHTRNPSRSRRTSNAPSKRTWTRCTRSAVN